MLLRLLKHAYTCISLPMVMPISKLVAYLHNTTTVISLVQANKIDYNCYELDKSLACKLAEHF